MTKENKPDASLIASSKEFRAISKQLGTNMREEMARKSLAVAVDASLERTLKLIQIIYYAKQVNMDERELTKLTKRYKQGIELIGEHLDEEIQKYQEKYGEI